MSKINISADCLVNVLDGDYGLGGGGSKGSKFKTVKVVKLNSALNLSPLSP